MLRWARGVVVCAITLVSCKSSGPSQAEIEQKLAGAQPGEEREIEPGSFMTMYRQQATAPVHDGWQLAASTGGGFSVELPLPFNDFRGRSKGDDGVELRSDTVGGKSPGRLAWSATCVTRSDGKGDPPKTAQFTNKTESLGNPIRAWARTIVLPGRLCVAIVEAQGTDPLPGEADIQRFLMSFKQTPSRPNL